MLLEQKSLNTLGTSVPSIGLYLVLLQVGQFQLTQPIVKADELAFYIRANAIL